MRLGEPEMPSLLVSHHRPGFYFRVITEGHVHAGAEIVRIGRGRHQLSVADVDALLYLPDRDTDQLRQIVDEPALSPGWQQSFCDMLAAHENSVTATSPPVGVEPGWTGFRPLRVTATQRETANVLSIEFVSVDRTPLPTPLAGQYLTIRIPDAGDPAPLRSYSLSGDRFAGYLPPINPGVVGAGKPKRPHQPDGPPGTGPRITFARSGLSVNWSPDYRSILEIAEACDVPTRFSCRTGVCHTCITGVLDGITTYSPPPLEEPADGEVLICSAAPGSDLVLDL
jgi:ferredoxin